MNKAFGSYAMPDNNAKMDSRGTMMKQRHGVFFAIYLYGAT